MMRNPLKGNGEPEEVVYLGGRGDNDISSAHCRLALPDVACVVTPWCFTEKLCGLCCHRITTTPEKLFFLP